MYSIDNKKFPCNTSLTMYDIGGKWKSVILIHKKKRYNELQKKILQVLKLILG